MSPSRRRMHTIDGAELREQLEQQQQELELELERDRERLAARAAEKFEGQQLASAATAIATPAPASDGNAEVEFRCKDSAKTDKLYRNVTIDEGSGRGLQSDESYGDHYEEPRVRSKHKKRDWDRKQRTSVASTSDSTSDAVPDNAPPKTCAIRTTRSRVHRRNTVDCALLNALMDEDGKRTDKRLQSIIRNSERDVKSSATGLYEPAADTETLNAYLPANVAVDGPVCISTNCYYSVSSKPIGSRVSAPPATFNQQLAAVSKSPLEKRRDFHETFKKLVKLGSSDRQEVKPTEEEETWQAQLKDVIWLELQAWRADRSLEQQDKYFYEARKSVPELLTQIMNYRFRPKFRRELSTDSGVDSTTDSSHSCYFNSSLATPADEQSTCRGCMSLYCNDCIAQQQFALKEIEELQTRLETAEALYPSSKAMGALHPIYKSAPFVARIKAMCLWFNVTTQNLAKLTMLGKIFERLQCEKFSWPVQTSSAVTSDSGNSSITGNDFEETCMDSPDSAWESSPMVTKPTSLPKVQFLINDEEVAPGDTTSSNDSSSTEFSLQTPELPIACFRKNSMQDLNIFSVEPLGAFGNISNGEQSSALYRRFMENVLKQGSPAKSLGFLEKMYAVVLHKEHISLQKPGPADYAEQAGGTELNENHIKSGHEASLEGDTATSTRLSPYISLEQERELRRYGYWSAEAQSLHLPSYIPAFIFLSGLPLQFMHEFLRMRLEARAMKVNPLSMELILKELHEGLTLALMHRDHYQRHVTTALAENEQELEQYMGILVRYDATLAKALELYLDYLVQLVFAATSILKQKCILEKEWVFTKLVCPMINGMHALACEKYTEIISRLLRNISKRLVDRLMELRAQVNETQSEKTDLDVKWQLLTICRETQALFTEERECSLKVIAFAKTFCRDIETKDFHREHCDYGEDESDGDAPAEQLDNLVCDVVRECIKSLQQDMLDVRDKLSLVIQHVQDLCCATKLTELDESERQAIFVRMREIMREGYKFGFDYHKELKPLIIPNCNQQTCESVAHKAFALGTIKLARMWLTFVTERCEPGRGVRSRWAAQGMEFLVLTSSKEITIHLSEEQFETYTQQMDLCISHLHTRNPNETDRIARKKASPRARKNSSPATSRSRTPSRTPSSAGILVNTTGSPLQSPQYNKLLHPQFSLKEESLQQIRNYGRLTPTEQAGDLTDSMADSASDKLRLIVPETPTSGKPKLKHALDLRAPASHADRVRDAINRLDMDLDRQLRERDLIGQVKEKNPAHKVQIRSRSVQFRWHRGIKLGKGRFGTVYTAVNNNTGELMAMKEISTPQDETRVLGNVADELKILEGVRHPHLVQYYGVEMHREDLLIFMELCAEGTLESLVEISGALPEGITRRYTAQLLAGVCELHKHGIVHRDIKTANIFLVDGSNSLKLGDFGCAAKLHAQTTVAGELKAHIGTQAYMAPEVFNSTLGHGRSADIWSVGCVVIEMASGKRPWPEIDTSFQIMYKVGRGCSPSLPDNLSAEGIDFLNYCIQHDPKMRRTAVELLEHNFCKYGLGEEFCREDPLDAAVGRSIRRVLRRS